MPQVTEWPDVAQSDLGRLYPLIQQFYARHFQLLDKGAAREWAQTFTEDGSFAPPSLPEPIRGRAALAAAVTRAHADLVRTGEQHRHWHGMIAIDPQDQRTLQVRCYALIIATPRDGHPRIHLSCVCEDQFRLEADGEWRVHERRVTRDDKA